MSYAISEGRYIRSSEFRNSARLLFYPLDSMGARKTADVTAFPVKFAYSQGSGLSPGSAQNSISLREIGLETGIEAAVIIKYSSSVMAKLKDRSTEKILEISADEEWRVIGFRDYQSQGLYIVIEMAKTDIGG